MINKALRIIRQYHEYKQIDLAKEIGISKSYLSEIESGKKPVTLELLNKYSVLFDIPVSSLVFFSENIGRSNLSSTKFKKVVASKIINVMEWFVERNDKKIKE